MSSTGMTKESSVSYLDDTFFLLSVGYTRSLLYGYCWSYITYSLSIQILTLFFIIHY
ncbi:MULTISPECIES: hypothetical protein [unclassified Wolbachia]|uniref:hypothetical protein n=2 Tax=unclassified Wolbachia TaxID=2640676 RepID=UPI000A4B3F72|nr:MULTISPECIES: hypothetical protein [unclassified Wolbachia]